MQIAKRVYSLAQEHKQDWPAVDTMIRACNCLAVTLSFMGDFGLAEQYAMRGARIGGE
jgi:hypothetical protein